MSDRDFSRIVGVIGKPYGLDGSVFVRLITDYPETIIKGNHLYIDAECTEKVIIEDIRRIIIKGKNRTVFKFHSCSSIDDAENFRNKPLYRNKEDSPVLEVDNYWVGDLIGCAVYLHDKKYIGIVEDVEKYAYNDNLVIKNSKNIITIVPMMDHYIGSIDIKKKKIILKILPEYI